MGLTSIIGKVLDSVMPYRESSMTVLPGAASMGWSREAFDPRKGVASFGGWVYAAASINAIGVGSVPLRLYARGTRSGGRFTIDGKDCLFRTRPVPRSRRKYLLDAPAGPHRDVRRKMMEFDEFEEVVESHPLTDLLQTVNPMLNGFDLTVLRMTWLQLTGNAYLLMVGGQVAPVDQLWPLPPQWTWVIPDEGDGWVKGYLYGAKSDKRVMFDRESVIHFRLPNPASLLYGMGKVEAAWSVIGINEANHDMDTALAHNHARPDYAVIMEGAQPDQAKLMQAELDRRLKGSRKAGRSLVLGGPKVTLTPLQFPPKDLSGRDEVVEEIAAVFGVPVSMLKANDPNLASAKAGYQSWREGTILPLCRFDEQTLNAQLVPLFGDDLVLAYDSPVAADREFELRRSTSLVGSGIVTINEARQEDGYEPLQDPLADKPMVNGQPLGGAPVAVGAFRGLQIPDVSLTQADSVAPSNSSEVPQTNKETVLNGAQIQAAQEIVLAVAAGDLPRDSGVGMLQTFFNLDPALAEQIMGSAGNPSIPTTPNPKPNDQSDEGQPKPQPTQDSTGGTSQSKMLNGAVKVCDCHDKPEPMSKAWRRMKASADDTVRDDEPDNPISRLSRELERIFTAQRDEIASMLVGKKTIAPRRLDDNIEAILRHYDRMTDDAVRAFFEEVMRAGIDAGVSKLEIEAVIPATNPAVSAWLQTNTVRLVEQIRGYTQEQVSNTIARGLDQGLTMAEISAQMMDDTSVAGGSLSGLRAETIARTESARGYVEGQNLAWKESGVVEGRQWLLAPGACPFCAEVAKRFNGKTVPFDEPFFKQGSVIEAGGQRMTLDYSDVDGPPLHPNDRCDLIPVIKEAP